MSISKEEIFTFLQAHHLAVASTVAADGTPESALIYAVGTPELDLIFYTLATARKCENLRRDGRIALVVGWPGEAQRSTNQDTLQYEGVASELVDTERETAKEIYLAALPQNAGMSTWPDLTFFRVRPGWIRYSSYGHPWRVEEMRFERAAPPVRRRWLSGLLR